MKRILIATDGSETAHDALELGLELAAEHDATAYLVYVAPSVEVLPYAGIGGGIPRVPHYVSEEDREVLTDAARIAAEKGIEARTELFVGDPAAEIVGFAERMDADLIVVGSHGYGPIASTLLGSVSRGVLHRSRRAVLVVRGVRVSASAATP